MGHGINQKKPDGESGLNHKEKGFIFPDQAHIHAGALFDRALTTAEVTHLRIETLVAICELGILSLLNSDLLLKLPDLRKATLANPQAHLQNDDKNSHDSPQHLHLKSLIQL
tara:strand:+ start:169 stop:504 length:336 start_codon:yes stop_codon:yes gene_type:complete